MNRFAQPFAERIAAVIDAPVGEVRALIVSPPRPEMGQLAFPCFQLAKALGEHHPTLTIGTDEGTAGALEQLGAKHQNCPTTEFVIDVDQKIVTTPAYISILWTDKIGQFMLLCAAIWMSCGIFVMKKMIAFKY